VQDTETLLSRRQAAARLGRSYNTVRRWEAEGRLKVRAYEGEGPTMSPRFAESDIDALAAELHKKDAHGMIDPNDLIELREEVERLRAEVERMRAENEMLKDDSERKQSFIERLETFTDRLLQVPASDVEALRRSAQVLSRRKTSDSEETREDERNDQE
jgi:hypothetical protein